MTPRSCETLIYFIGGLDNVKWNERNGIEIMHDAIREELKNGKGESSKTLLHQYEQSMTIPVRTNKHGPTVPIFTALTADQHAKGINLAIQEAVDHNNPKKLVVIAYSCGTALFRRALADQKDSPTPSWTEKLAKVFYIGGMTTGWQFNSEIPKHYLLVGPTLRPFCSKWFPWQLYKGSKFITDTRIQLNRKAVADREQYKEALPEIHLLGTKDEYISPVDAIELGGKLADDNSAYFEVADCTHQTILSTKDNREANKHVLEFIVQSLRGQESTSAKEQRLRKIHPDDVDDYLDPLDNEPARRDDSVDRVFIILHGIRDNGTWAQKISSRIKDQWRKKNPKDTRSMRVVSASYGYFSMWDFLRPGGRANAIEWYQNLYANVCALYPKAKISFVGHSNGTYLGAEALQCESLTYETMVLAGSVVRRDFWDKPKKGRAWRSRVKRVFNFRSVDDFIVGLLPGGLEVIPVLGNLMNVGGAGAYGFHWLTRGRKSWKSSKDTQSGAVTDPIDQVDNFILNQRFIHGGHGAAIKPDTWDQLAEHLLTERPPGGNGHLEPIQEKHRFLRFANDFTKSTWLLRAIVGTLVYGALLICASPFILPVLALGNLMPQCLMIHFPLMMAISLAASVVVFAVLRRF